MASNSNTYWKRLSLIGALVTAPAWVVAQYAGETATVRGKVDRDIYVAGGTVNVVATVDGDTTVAGGRVSVNGRIAGDVLAAGGTVDVRGDVADDVRAAGGSLVFDGRIGGDLVAAGGSVRVEPGAQVVGRSWLAGGDVELAGTVGNELRAAGGVIVIAGHVHGDVLLTGGRIQIMPTAVIDGNLTYRSQAEANIDPEAKITGEVTYQSIREVEPSAAAIAAVRIGWVFSILIAGVVLYLLFPEFVMTAARAIKSDPGKSIVLGFALLVTVPVVAVLAAATVVGVPLALVALATYFVAVLAGFAIGVLFVGDVLVGLFRRRWEVSRGWGVVLMLVGTAALALIQFIPIAGGTIELLAVVFGVGALSVRTYRVYVRKANC